MNFPLVLGFSLLTLQKNEVYHYGFPADFVTFTEEILNGKSFVQCNNFLFRILKNTLDVCCITSVTLNEKRLKNVMFSALCSFKVKCPVMHNLLVRLLILEWQGLYCILLITLRRNVSHQKIFQFQESLVW